MDRTDVLLAARSTLADSIAGIAAILRAQPDSTTPIGGGSYWTLREMAVHLVVASNLHRDLAAGATSPITSLAKADLAALSDQLIDDVAESDPGKLADLVVDAAETFQQETAGRPGEQPVWWHCATQLDLAAITSVLAADCVLHGYDMAAAVGAPWPITADDAVLAISAYVPLMGLFINPATSAGHSAAYGIEVRGGPAATVRFTDGVYALEAPGGPVDCEISVDPVAFLLAFSGRMSRWQAIALGLISARGEQPGLALGFPDLFIFP